MALTGRFMLSCGRDGTHIGESSSSLTKFTIGVISDSLSALGTAFMRPNDLCNT